MKFLVVFAVAVACAAADVSHLVAPILKSKLYISPVGDSFQYAYETTKGINQQANAVFKNTDDTFLEIKEPVSPESTPLTLEYIPSNEDGFQPTGSHIPQSPPIPELILRSLEYIQ